MQEMQRPDGSMLAELFTGQQVQTGAAERRRKLLEQLGYKFVALKPVSENKYGPHQGSKEIARRVKQWGYCVCIAHVLDGMQVKTRLVPALLIEEREAALRVIGEVG